MSVFFASHMQSTVITPSQHIDKTHLGSATGVDPGVADSFKLENPVGLEESAIAEQGKYGRKKPHSEQLLCLALAGVVKRCIGS